MEDMKSKKKRANLENAPPLRYYPTTLLGEAAHSAMRGLDPAPREVYTPHSARSCRPASKEHGGGDRRPGTASPLKTRALARCTQHESTVS